MSRHDLIQPVAPDGLAPAGVDGRYHDGRDYDVGPDCPYDELQRRLDAARARLRLHPPALGPMLRWTI